MVRCDDKYGWQSGYYGRDKSRSMRLHDVTSLSRCLVEKGSIRGYSLISLSNLYLSSQIPLFFTREFFQTHLCLRRRSNKFNDKLEDRDERIIFFARILLRDILASENGYRRIRNQTCVWQQSKVDFEERVRVRRRGEIDGNRYRFAFIWRSRANTHKSRTRTRTMSLLRFRSTKARFNAPNPSKGIPSIVEIE